MGYLSTFSGRIDIDPPLTAAELRALDLPVDIKVDVREETRDTDDGVLTVRRGLALVPAYEDAFTGYDFEPTLRAAVKQIAPGHQLTGRIRVEGEDQGDV